MKYNYTLKLFFLLLLPFISNSQTAVSISNGSWMSPMTWNCSCVPFTGYSVTINHSVTLNTSMVFNTGGVTINNSGSLIQDASMNRDMWINGGYFINNGRADLRYFLVSAGSSSNAGTFTMTAFTNSVSFVNSGTITMDSMYTAAGFTNTGTGRIFGDSLTTGASFINDGRMNVTAVTNKGTFRNNNYFGGVAFTNSNNFENNDTLALTGSMWNNTVFTNKPTGNVSLAKSFHNYHSSGTAVFDNNGFVQAFDSWYNTDTVKGNGQFVVTDTTANSGAMKGSFDFCDLSHPSPPPLVDLNSGTISNAITWCIYITGVKDYSKEKTVTVFPNPNTGTFTIKGKEEDLVTVANELGQLIMSVELSEANQFTQTIRDLPAGFYIISGKNIKSRLIISE